MNWEKWLKENQMPKQKPIHFTSMNNWAQRLYDLVLETEKPIIFFDHRFNWFALNWHFLRHSFYTTNYAVIHPTVFINFLMNDSELTKKLTNKKIIYIQSVTTETSDKPVTDKQTKLFDAIISYLIEKQKVEPEIITNNQNRPLAKIWQLEWQPSIEIKPSE